MPAGSVRRGVTGACKDQDGVVSSSDSMCHRAAKNLSVSTPLR